ncbi:unnamed protein product [Lactuca saligna]|uniref:Uncharacterized protein n=1 Tax=Lactuca saligna TaxID=75948 RepID=A0AA35YWJ2_LACSI|nr:unnamed protein product [Lactuca saligna]
MGGTFNQTKPLDLLVGSRVCFSFDPRSATDRWPIVFLERVVSKLFDQDLSEAVSFLLSYLVVNLMPQLVYPGRVFTNYAVPGDDVVIADENVATRYKESLDLLQVVISKEKSLISRSGSAEFANNFRVRDLTVDLPRLGGAGYRVLARLDHRRPRRYSHLVVMGLKLLSPSYPLDFWLGKGRPLSPEAHGRLVRLLRAKLKPRELILPPDELFETEESRYFLEYSLLYGWMRQWLNYLKWYHLTALSPWVTLEELFSGPVVSHSWRMVAVDEDLVRFSLEVVYRSALFKFINQAVK